MDFDGSAAAEDAFGVSEPMETGGFSTLLAGAADLGWPQPDVAWLDVADGAPLVSILGLAPLQEEPQEVASVLARLQTTSLGWWPLARRGYRRPPRRRHLACRSWRCPPGGSP